ncbi:MAG: hypothetical protein KGV43_02900 [Arcobacter sp.]|nr:hypothetical protein [Arcobacter sp.]
MVHVEILEGKQKLKLTGTTSEILFELSIALVSLACKGDFSNLSKDETKDRLKKLVKRLKRETNEIKPDMFKKDEINI